MVSLKDFFYQGRIGELQPRTLILASDATTVSGRASYGYVINNGLYGLAAFPHSSTIIGQDATTVAELQAIAIAMSLIGREESITVITDSRAAIRYLHKWHGGLLYYPEGYMTTDRHGRAPTLVRLATGLNKRSGSFETQWVKAHNEHPLNELADSLAKLALRTVVGRNTPDEAKKLAHSYVSGRLMTK